MGGVSTGLCVGGLTANISAEASVILYERSLFYSVSCELDVACEFDVFAEDVLIEPRGHTYLNLWLGESREVKMMVRCLAICG